jgi:hypothetical protein
MPGYGFIAPGVHLEMGRMADAVVREEPGQAGEKGLRSGALGMLSGIVIGVASTAPGYSLAASLGLVVAAVGLQAPAIMFLAFGILHGCLKTSTTYNEETAWGHNLAQQQAAA